MSLTPARFCPLCGFENCETISQSLAVAQSHAESRLNQNEPSQNEPNHSHQIDTAAKLLKNSKSALICGLDHLDSAAQLAAWKLADQIHAIVDSSLINSSQAAIQTTQRNGKVSATYGQVRNHSDLLVFWDCELKTKHPCLLRLLTSNCVPDRKIVFVGPSDSPMARMADLVFALDTAESRNSMIRLICRLRAKVAGRSLPDDSFSTCDLPPHKIQELFIAMQSAAYGSLFFTFHEPDGEFDLETESLLQLVSEFNAIKPLASIKVPNTPNGLGAESILTLASGFPHAISLQRGKAASFGSLYSAAEVLRRSDCDTILLCGNTDEDVSISIPAWLKTKLEQFTVIQLARRPETFADLFITCPTLEFGTAFEGSIFRGDGVMLSANVINPDHSAEKVLQSLAVAYQKL